MENNKIKFNLSQKNIQELPFDKYEKNFTFIIDDQKYETSRIVADLLSPTIRRAHLTDPTLDKFYINHKHNHDQKNEENKNTNHFSDFLKLVNYQTIEIEIAQIDEYCKYFYELGNEEEYFRLQLIPLIKLKYQTTSQYSQNSNDSANNDKNNDNKNENSEINILNNFREQTIEEIISFISSHFYELEIEKIKKLPKSIIESIVSNSSLQISNEDDFFQFINELYLTDNSYCTLFEYVLFNNVSDENFEAFIDTFNIEDLNINLWRSICTRFFPIKNPPSLNIARYQSKSKSIQNNIKEFIAKNGGEFSGIMKYLTNSTHGNIHDNGTIEIKSNSFQGDSYHPKNLVDYENNNEYASNDENNAFIQFDFKDRRIQLTDYSIKSAHNGDQNWAHMRNWVLEVSNDGERWEEIDNQSNDSTLNKRNIASIFKIKKETKEFYRYVRLRQTGYSWYLFPNHNRYVFWLQLVEFFGKLEEPQQK